MQPLRGNSDAGCPHTTSTLGLVEGETQGGEGGGSGVCGAMERITVDVWALLWEGLSPDRQENTSLQCVFLLTLVPNIHTWHTRLRHLSAHPSPPPPPSLSTSGASVWPVLKLSWWWCSSLTVVWAEERQTGRKPMRRKERDMSGPQSLGRSLTVEKVCSSSLGLPAETTVSRKWRG